MPRPTLDGAVAHAEDPAVAGQQLAVRRRRPRARARTPASRRRGAGCGSRCGRRRPSGGRRACGRPIDERQPGGVAVGRDDERRAVGDPASRAVLVVGAVTPTMRPVRSSRTGPVTAVRSCSRAPRLLRWRASISSKSMRGADQAVGRVARRGRARAARGAAAADDPQALVAEPAGLGRGVDAHGDELLDRARRQAVAADLLARERRLLQQQDVEPGLGEVGTRSAEPAGPAPTTMTSAVAVTGWSGRLRGCVHAGPSFRPSKCL